jgi:phytoene synthase
MTDNVHYTIFRNGSRTYFHTSLFFPPDIRQDVFALYAFVRTADDLVDSVPQKKDEFYEFCTRWERSLSGQTTGDPVIDAFSELSVRKKFSDKWAAAFLSSMESDLYVSEYGTLAELDKYLYGSAEVIGLFMARILDLPDQTCPQARSLGRAMQFVNFIRDIAEDLSFGRTYMPQEDLHQFSLPSLTYDSASRHPEEFIAFIRFEIERYREWQAAGERGYSVIPYRYLIPIRTSSDMYNWTASQIAHNPFIIYERKVKPSIPKIIFTLGTNAIRIPVTRNNPSFQHPSYGV